MILTVNVNALSTKIYHKKYFLFATFFLLQHITNMSSRQRLRERVKHFRDGGKSRQSEREIEYWGGGGGGG